MDRLNYTELSNEQRRQLIDAQQTFAAWRPAALELEGMGSMGVSVAKGRQYVYQAHGRVRKSNGCATPELLAKVAAHKDRRSALTTRVRSLGKRLEQTAPVNRALRLGGLRRTAAGIVRELDRQGLLGSHIIVAGTNALHAYEVAAGVVIAQAHVATIDTDLLWDNRLLLAGTPDAARIGLMGILQRVDKSFGADYGFNATNDEGLIVDLICPESDSPTTMKRGSDLEATPMPGLEWLLAAPRFEQTIIAEDGYALRIVVSEPRTFALHKLWVSQRVDRDATKKPRDRDHAVLVAGLAQKFLGLKFAPKDMPWLPTELKKLMRELRGRSANAA